ncbi:MAG: hypothetical protein WD045_13765 [Pirellulaceae bacterium]
MEARRTWFAVTATLLLSQFASLALAAGARTQNFIVTAPDPVLARKVATEAERFRKELAEDWLGRELPAWHQPCPITVEVGGGAGGETSFAFHGRVPLDWRMRVQGPQERILDSVLPHEVLHTVFATHYGRPLPRWADEGACTTVEHDVERNKNTKLLYHFLHNDRGIAFNKMFAMKEYPADVLPLYAQGHSLARYLIAQGGKRKFVNMVGEGMDSNNWPGVIRKHYGHSDISSLQIAWLEWVREGSDVGRIASTGRDSDQAASGQLASNDRGSVIRGQSPSPSKGAPVSLASHDAAPKNSPYLMASNRIEGHDDQEAEPSRQSRTRDLTAPVVPLRSEEARGQDITPVPHSGSGPVSGQAYEAREATAARGPARTSSAAPVFYLPGGTSLYR